MRSHKASKTGFERTLLIITRNHWALPLPTSGKMGQTIGSKQSWTTGCMLLSLKQCYSRPDNADHRTQSWIDRFRPLSTRTCSIRTRDPGCFRCVGSNQIMLLNRLLSRLSVSHYPAPTDSAIHSTLSSINNPSTPLPTESLQIWASLRRARISEGCQLDNLDTTKNPSLFQWVTSRGLLRLAYFSTSSNAQANQTMKPEGTRI